jgi:hypothetical protein
MEATVLIAFLHGARHLNATLEAIATEDVSHELMAASMLGDRAPRVVAYRTPQVVTSELHKW